MSLNGIVKSALGIAALAAACNVAAAPKGVAVTVVPEKSALGQDDDVVVRVTITNTSSAPHYILKSRTPFDGVEEALFEVRRDGQAVPYLGAHIKRAAPTAADYFVLKPGASHSVKVELSALYDMSVSGDYQISFRQASPQLFLAPAPGSGRVGAAAAADLDSASADSASLVSAPATVWIDGRVARGQKSQAMLDIEAMKAAAAQPAAASLSYSKCTTSQQATIASAMAAGSTMAGNSDTYMQNGAIGARYTKWFGANNATRVATVKSHFAAIKDAFANKPVTVDCGCKQSYYAYVYPTQPYKIYVCKAFWTAPMTGTDSKGGTLVHEMSHFNVVAGTDDHVYGQSGAASLAISNPAQAVDNADSHEYFAENTPALN
ncbi:M35 family metallo-endopeptidase [Massilia yuzhufengensis]|uniref:Extracellular peptidase. Metallo peptidase. MEROPS family M35 n=1 Tax=Massilia yuzhufengensis TaxID=1164594 RepID=A0A1I1MQY8_9BURK|nr:M35 family metallo-endopeptidase [Massilia yuzhufengensis]SFC85003.1 extracellular peptidase. Metallo peptidase. MEROPS family M35 [Massilia yuzhufengensis]